MIKDIKAFSAEEVGLWVTAQGLDPSKFLSEGVDGDLLLSLSLDDLKNDLGLSSLQAKKVMKNIEFSQNLARNEGGGSEEVSELTANKKELEAKVAELEKKLQSLETDVKAKDNEIAGLKKQMNAEKEEKAAAPTPAPKRASAPARGPGVVGGAARGAAGGAVKGAIGKCRYEHICLCICELL